MDHKVIGTTMPVLEMQLEAGESIVAEGGELSWMTGPIELETAASGKAGAKGMFGAVKRAVAGGSLFMTEYTAKGGAGMVAFATKVPGQILPIQVSEQPELHGPPRRLPVRAAGRQPRDRVPAEVQRRALRRRRVHPAEGVGRRARRGSSSTARSSTTTSRRARRSWCTPGHVGMFEAGMAFELERIKGIKNILFGADALFLAKLTGPGKVWLQTLPLPNLAAALAPYLATDQRRRARAASSRSGTSTSATTDRLAERRLVAAVGQPEVLGQRAHLTLVVRAPLGAVERRRRAGHAFEAQRAHALEVVHRERHVVRPDLQRRAAAL